MARTQTKVDRHAHGCKRCRTYYEDACENRSENDLCFECRTGKTGWTILIEGRSPKDCCLYESKKASKDQMKVYRLAGNLPWWICGHCARVQVYEPGSLADPRKQEKR